MRHFIEPGSFSLAEQLALLDLADRMEADPAPYAHLCDCLLYTSDAADD